MKYEYRLHVEMPNGITVLVSQQTSGEWEEAWMQMSTTVEIFTDGGMAVLAAMLYSLDETPLDWFSS